MSNARCISSRLSIRALARWSILVLALGTPARGIARGPADPAEDRRSGGPLPDSAAKRGSTAGAHLTPRDWLVIGPVGRYGRTNLHTDALEAALITGTWQPPRSGDTLRLSDGTSRRWQAARADGSGRLEHEALAGGYAFTTLALPVDTPAPHVLILEASGHSVVYVNGVPRAGDPYGAGWARLPVALEPGENSLLLLCPRPAVQVRLVAARAPAELDSGDLTTPDLIVGEPTATWGAIPVLNTTTDWVADLALDVTWPDGAVTRTSVPPLAPLVRRKCAFELRGPAPAAPGRVPLVLRLARDSGASPAILDEAEVSLAVRDAADKHKRTFLSRIDGSVQYFAVTPAHPPPDAPDRPALVLTLHGAAVEATNQANAYDHKDWAHIVAPTNRRPFGFDWEDWGRLDALEVLDLAARRFDTDPRRTYLTGHSMGGHGAWQIGAQHPDRFAAIAPSAGWISFTSYTGAPADGPESAVAQLLRRAASPSDTLALVRNYLHFGVYVLHGAADDNVPVSEARALRAQLGGFHPDFAYYERPGAGHWWGDACVDWPPLFAFLRERVRPAAHELRTFEFGTASPGTSARCAWIVIHNQIRTLAPSRVKAELDVAQRRITLVTENVARLMLDLAALYAARPGFGTAAGPDRLVPGEPVHIAIDGETLAGIAWPAGDLLWLERADVGWTSSAAPSPAWKSPPRYGPFKAVFENRCLLVVGTAGTPAENAWALAKARYDAETFLYRGNGVLDLVRDRDFDPAAEPDRNVVLYGNAATNAAWPALLARCPVEVRRDALTLDGRRLAGDDLAALFVRPRPGSDVALVGVIGGTGLPGLRLTERLPLFLSGVAWPDCTVLDTATLTTGLAGVRCTGFFGDDWLTESGEFAWGADE